MKKASLKTVPENWFDASDEKKSRLNKTRRKKVQKEESNPNYSLVIYIIIAVCVLNILLKLFIT